MKRAQKREHLIGVATELFNRLGYRATGIDQVIAEAGVAKTTLYRHFKSKDDLIVAVLRQVDETFRDDMRTTVDQNAAKPRDKLLATFDYLEHWFKSDAFYGCPFVSAAGEFGEKNSLVFQEAATHKRLVKAYFEELARAASFRQARQLAEQINLLHEGAIAEAHLSGNPQVAQKAKAIATLLLDQADRRTEAAATV